MKTFIITMDNVFPREVIKVSADKCRFNSQGFIELHHNKQFIAAFNAREVLSVVTT